MSRDPTRLEIDDQLHCDLLAERIVESGTGSILDHQQYRSCFVEAFRMAAFGLFLQPRWAS
jgi:hypothetical protein